MARRRPIARSSRSPLGRFGRSLHTSRCASCWNGLALSALLPSILACKPSARADLVTFLVAAAATAAIHWVVRRVLDAVAGDSFKSNAKFIERSPSPSGGTYVYHDSFGNPFIVNGYSQPWTYSRSHEFSFSLRQYLGRFAVDRMLSASIASPTTTNSLELITLQNMGSAEANSTESHTPGLLALVPTARIKKFSGRPCATTTATLTRTIGKLSTIASSTRRTSRSRRFPYGIRNKENPRKRVVYHRRGLKAAGGQSSRRQTNQPTSEWRELCLQLVL